MKRIWISALCAGLAAFGITNMVAEFRGKEAAESTTDRRAADRSGSRQSGSSRSSAARAKTDDFRSAWENLAERKLPKNQRILAQRKLFDAWAEVDLHAAIEAALGERWNLYYDGALALLASPVLVERSEDVWQLIRSGELNGPASSLLLNTWIRAVATKNPELATAYLQDLDGLTLSNALGSVVVANLKPAAAQAIWRATMEREDLTSEDRSIIAAVMAGLGKTVDVATLREMSGSKNQLLAESAVRALVSRFGADVSYDLVAIPDELRPVMAAEILKTPGVRPPDLVKSVEYLAASGEWEILASNDASRAVASLAVQMGAVETANWVSSLPSREETVEIFHRGVEPYIQQDREAAWEWMSGLPAGTWRDRAFAEYSQQSLNRWQDPAASRTALDQIQDPTFKATAEQWRSDWQTRTGQR